MKRLISLILLVSIGLAADAAVKLSPIFSSHMVLQQQSMTGIWGTATPGATVSVVTSWNGSSYSAQAASDGRWRVDVTTPSYGGPYTVTVASGKKDRIVLEDVLIGEVWLCGGQSNMEMRMSSDVVGGKEDMEKAASNKGIRILHVDRRRSYDEEYEPVLVGDGWNLCNFNTLFDFSAAAFYFGRKLNEELDVPVGLIESCWGGSLIEPWISSATGAYMPESFGETGRAIDLGEDNEKQVADWNETVSGICQGMAGGKPSWAAKVLDDSGWADYEVPGIMEEQLGCPEFDGIFWMRKTVEVPRSLAGKPASLVLDAVDDYDFAYVNGQYITHGEGYTTKRNYSIPAGVLKAGKNVIALRILDVEGDAGIYETAAGNSLRFDDGSVISLNGTWKAKLDAPVALVPEFPQLRHAGFSMPTLMYNAMIAPLVGYDIRGVIWYQGCSNVGSAEKYDILQRMLIHDWRSKWGHELPFYITQLANYLRVQTGVEDSDWARLREAQALSAKNVKGAGMACIIDIGEADDIHPKDKVDVGERLAFQALHRTYGRDFAFCGPEYAGYSIEGGAVRISFDYCFDGLRTGHRDMRKLVTNFIGEPVEGFTIAGPDKVFHKAEARIDGNTVVVSSKEVPCPVAVRYAWADNPICNLYNGAGMPAVPFRTDNWQKQ